MHDDASSRLIGRGPELEKVRELLRDRTARSLVLTGAPGIGKTTLWEAGVAVARAERCRVLAAKAAEAEAKLENAALVDLMSEVGGDDLAGLPPPQRRALEVALLRVDPGESPPEAGAIAVGFLNALRSLAAAGPVLVAVDDLPWLDAASADVVAFAARRLRDEPVRFLLARRPGLPTEIERALGPSRLERFDVQPLSIGAIRRMLSDQLGLSLPRRVLRRLFESAEGNPLFALELGRTLVDRPLPELGEDMPLPETLDDVLGSRIAGLSGGAARVLLGVALDTDLRIPQLETLFGRQALEEALDAGVVTADGDRVRSAHPLLGAAALRRSRPQERALLHRELAAAVGDEGRRARHLALAAESPDAELAAAVAAAADAAGARGARQDAVELAEHALRLTRRDEPARPERLLALAEHLAKAGEPRRAAALLEPEIDALPEGLHRAQAWLLVAEASAGATQEEYLSSLDRALAESAGDPGVRAHVLARRANNAAAVRIAALADAEAWALEALEHAPHAGPDVEQLALYALAWVRIFRGRPIDDLLARAPAHPAAVYVRSSLDRVACDRLAWRGELSAARAIARRLMSAADAHGEARSYLAVLSQLCEIEIRAGELDTAAQLLDEWEQSSSDRFASPVYERCRSLVAVCRGLPGDVAQLTDEVVARSESLGKGWDLLDGLRAQGLAALHGRDPERAADLLRRVWRYTTEEGIDDPGAFPVAPDLVEALVELGEADEAAAVTSRLRELAEAQEHPWGGLGAVRCEALVRLAGPVFDEQAAADLAAAAAGYARLGLRFDHARTLLALGRALRRLRKWKAARRSLEDAATAFDTLNAPGWAESARSELSRVGARRPRAAGELTEAERRVVELAVEGRSNKEIAHALVVAVPTVEAHLSHAYAKLGVRSRAQLGARLSARE